MRVLIADDEYFARQRIEFLLRSEPDVEILGQCTTAEEVVSALEAQPVDLVFLDIEMPGSDGFAVFPELAGSELPLVVFVTAYDEHAVRAFEVRAFDYLLKPCDPARMKQTIQRARVQLGRVKQAGAQEKLLALMDGLRTRPVRARFAVKSGGRIFFVPSVEVDWIEAEHNHIRLHVGKESHSLRAKLSDVETELDPKIFRRIHRSVIVNVDRIREVQPWFRGDYIVVLSDGQKLSMSRTFRDRLADMLD